MNEYKNTDMSNAIAEYIHVSRYRDILRLRYCEGMTFAEMTAEAKHLMSHRGRAMRRFSKMLALCEEENHADK